MRFLHRDAVEADFHRIVEIYNQAVSTRQASCDMETTTVAAQRDYLSNRPGNRPLWVAEDREDPDRGAIGYLGFSKFQNGRPGYDITSDLAIYIHADYQGRGLGSYLLEQAIAVAPSLGIEVFAVTIFASNEPSIRLFKRHGFEQWGYLPRVARLDVGERDVVIMGRRLGS